MRREKIPDRSLKLHWIGRLRWGYLTGIAAGHRDGPRIVLGVLPRADVHGTMRAQMHKARHVELDRAEALKLRNRLDELIDRLDRLVERNP